MCAYAREVAECTGGEEAVVYIDALPVFLKIVVRFREKVDGFQRLSVGFLLLVFRLRSNCI